MTRPFSSQGKCAAGERVIEPSGQGAAADHGKLGRGCQWAANQRAKDKCQRSFRTEWIMAGCTKREHQPCSKTCTAEKLAENVSRQFHPLCGAR